MRLLWHGQKVLNKITFVVVGKTHRTRVVVNALLNVNRVVLEDLTVNVTIDNND